MRFLLVSLALLGSIVAARPIDFRAVSGIAIPEGPVASVAVDDAVVWECVEIEYLETDGMQWIDTGATVTERTRIEAQWTQTGTAIQQRLFGVNDGSGKVFALYINNNGAWAVNTGTSSGGGMQKVAANTDYTGTFDLETGVCTINNTTRSNGGTPFNSTNTIPIFTRRNTGTAMTDYPAQMRLYWLRIYDGTDLVRDFAPRRLGTVGYLYDRVSGRLFGNAGPGSFILGPDKD